MGNLTAQTGKKVKIVANLAGHGFKIGDEVKITGPCGPAMWTARGKGGSYSVYESDFVPIHVTKEDMVKDIETLTKQKDDIQTKIDFMKESIEFLNDNDITVFVENEFKAYKVLKTINKDTTDIEKAKLIAKIIEG